MKQPIKFAFIAAMEREVAPLLKSCERMTLCAPAESVSLGPERRLAAVPKVVASGNGGRQPQTAYLFADAAIVCSGPGYSKAKAAARLAIEAFSPAMIVSIGFAGALTSDLRAGDLFVPRRVVSERTGSQFTATRGRGCLLTSEVVAGEDEKSSLFDRMHAQAVDMEAAAVAEMAAAMNCEFLAVKAISDELDSKVKFIASFLHPEGFRTAAFVAYVALRPWLWPAVRTLQQHSAKASESLCLAVRTLVAQGTEAVEKLCSGPARTSAVPAALSTEQRVQGS